MIVIEQPQNQNIAVVKTYRGTIDLTEDRFIAFLSLFLPILPILLGELQKGILVNKF